MTSCDSETAPQQKGCISQSSELRSIENMLDDFWQKLDCTSMSDVILSALNRTRDHRNTPQKRVGRSVRVFSRPISTEETQFSLSIGYHRHVCDSQSDRQQPSSATHSSPLSVQHHISSAPMPSSDLLVFTRKTTNKQCVTQFVSQWFDATSSVSNIITGRAPVT